MKNLSWFNKFIFSLNILAAILTLVGYFLPFLAPKVFPFLSVFTLFLPMLLLVNTVFLLYWALFFKRQILLSVFILVLGITFINKFYQFKGADEPLDEQDFVLMSYNVRLFNLFEWIDRKDVSKQIKSFIDKQDPDILCLQEYSKNQRINFSKYPFQHIVSHGNKVKTGQAIFSKYRIIDKGEIRLPNSNNNVIFADIVKAKDTLRVYSIHLQSISISPDIHERIDEQNGKKIFNRISKAFLEQQVQSELIRSHMSDAKHKKIICGDMNNSAYSYVYNNVKADLKDAFVEAGRGFGKSYDFDYFPMRIDYIFVDRSIQVKSFHTHSEFLNSDHFPLVTRLSFE